VPSDSVKKKFRKRMVTSSSNSNSTASCAVLYVETFSKMLPECSVRIANLRAMRNVSQKWSRNVLVNLMQKPTLMKRRLTIEFLIDLNLFQTSALTGVVIVAIFCLLVKRILGNALVSLI
jgi:hypothetical protein